MKNPLISCLCISNRRPNFLTNAIENFLAQTYQNKELIVVYNSLESKYDDIVTKYKRKEIRFHDVYDVHNTLTLGDLRNISIDIAKGKYICIWDDDDWYHCERLESQFQGLKTSKKPGCILAYFIIYDSISRKAYLSSPIFPANSILCETALLTKNIRYSSLNREEDDYFLKKLLDINALFPLVNPSLYIYVKHITNTCYPMHFNKLTSNSYELSKGGSKVIENVVCHKDSFKKASKLITQKNLLQEFDYLQTFRKAWYNT